MAKVIQSLQSLQAAGDTTRRNITAPDSLTQKKPGTKITIGNVQLEVIRIAAPCRLLDDVIGSGSARALSNNAGSICRVLSTGMIRCK